MAGHCPQCLLGIAIESEIPEEVDTFEGPLLSQSDSPVEAFPSTIGTMLGGRFKLVARIGSGGMGEVYRANDVRIGQPVALKFLPPAVSRNPDALRRLFSEIRLGRQVAHPNVSRLYDLAEADGQHFIVMEFVDGENLASLLALVGRLPGRRAMEVAHDLCAGLAACHDRQVIHGDLKPGNVMIDGNRRARIMDFGLSTVLGTRPEDRLMAGTLAYMAPEQLHGSGVSAQADIYALGLLLYEMFTGRRVHDVRTVDQLRRAMESQPAPPSTITRIPKQVEDMILRCLEKKPARRPRSPAEVATAFPAQEPGGSTLPAGQTPSPTVLTASEVGDLSVPTGWMLLGAAVMGLFLIIAGAERFMAVGRSKLPKNPDVLAEQAREIARMVAYPSRNADEAYGFTTRGRLRSRSEPPNSNLVFFYRSSPTALTPVESLRRIGPTDPPLDVPGTTAIGLDPAGGLRFLRILPPEQNVPAQVQPISWETLFARAALDSRVFIRTDSAWNPPVPYHQKQEWIANAPGNSGSSVRAALYGGRAVYFDVTDDRSGRPAEIAQADRWSLTIRTSHGVLLIVIVIAAGLLARRNVRKGRSDLRGARRVAGWVVASRLLYWILSADIGLIGINTQVIARGMGVALFEGAQVWLAYVALEPFVRRRWPRLSTGWSRLIDGRFNDPLVGRDLLVGGLFGILLTLVEQLRGWSAAHLGLAPPPPHHITLEMLSGGSEVAAAFFHCQARAFIYAFLGLFMFLLLRAVVSKTVIAGALWILLAAITWSRTEQPGTVLAVAVSVAIVQAILFLIVIVRFGLLASVMMFSVHLMLVIAPLTYDLTAWYSITSLAPLVIVAAVLVFAFNAALARKPLFGRRILEG